MNHWKLWQLWSEVNLMIYQNNKECVNLLRAFDGVSGLVCSPTNSLPFMLLILRILFDYEDPATFSRFSSKMAELPAHVWIPVLLQVLAHLASQSVDVRRIVQQLLVWVGLSHPHAVLFSLLVPLSLSKTEREKYVREILSKLRASHPTTVSSASLNI
jgi:FKBP12-rapamycin complex-associated protein